ncbi:MAG: YlbF family regulator [Bacilli bacterium]|jgi:cell fate (sporulation/competence/biofilm development) regulator YmcA (YheA/YmcA/DUF963 family)
MEIELADELYALKRLIDSDQRVLTLNRIENKLENDREAQSRAYEKDMRAISYEDALKHCADGSLEAKEAQKELYFAKKRMDELPISREYYAAYKEVRMLYESINHALFSDINKKVHLCD